MLGRRLGPKVFISLWTALGSSLWFVDGVASLLFGPGSSALIRCIREVDASGWGRQSRNFSAFPRLGYISRRPGKTLGTGFTKRLYDCICRKVTASVFSAVWEWIARGPLFGPLVPEVRNEFLFAIAFAPLMISDYRRPFTGMVSYSDASGSGDAVYIGDSVTHSGFRALSEVRRGKLTLRRSRS